MPFGADAWQPAHIVPGFQTDFIFLTESIRPMTQQNALPPNPSNPRDRTRADALSETKAGNEAANKAEARAEAEAEAERKRRDFGPAISSWQLRFGRNNLPWQCSDPYRVWLSEIMLQQTTAETVKRYYLRFLARFPTLQDLADAPLDDVLALWAGLGYYARAKNLRKTAQIIATEFGGRFPKEPENLRALPGIGRSTANAIACFAFGAKTAILDGNVKRVLRRVFGIEGDPKSKQTENALWALAESLVPPSRNAAYIQGLMDLGATLCAPRKTRCEACPVRLMCQARASGDPTGGRARDPAPKPGAIPASRAERQSASVVFLAFVEGDRVWAARRGENGIWPNLWAPPCVVQAIRLHSPSPAAPGNAKRANAPAPGRKRGKLQTLKAAPERAQTIALAQDLLRRLQDRGAVGPSRAFCAKLCALTGKDLVADAFCAPVLDSAALLRALGQEQARLGPGAGGAGAATQSKACACAGDGNGNGSDADADADANDARLSARPGKTPAAPGPFGAARLEIFPGVAPIALIAQGGEGKPKPFADLIEQIVRQKAETTPSGESPSGPTF